MRSSRSDRTRPPSTRPRSWPSAGSPRSRWWTRTTSSSGIVAEADVLADRLPPDPRLHLRRDGSESADTPPPLLVRGVMTDGRPHRRRDGRRVRHRPPVRRRTAAQRARPRARPARRHRQPARRPAGPRPLRRGPPGGRPAAGRGVHRRARLLGRPGHRGDGDDPPDPRDPRRVPRGGGACPPHPGPHRRGRHQPHGSLGPDAGRRRPRGRRPPRRRIRPETEASETTP